MGMMLLANIIPDTKNVIFLLLELRLKSLDQIANSPKLLNIGQIANFLWMTMRNLDLSELLYRARTWDIFKKEPNMCSGLFEIGSK